jgi:hypothetical protein
MDTAFLSSKAKRPENEGVWCRSEERVALANIRPHLFTALQEAADVLDP